MKFHQNWIRSLGCIVYTKMILVCDLWPLVTLKIRLHGSKSIQLLWHVQGVFPPWFVEFGPVVSAQSCTQGLGNSRWPLWPQWPWYLRWLLILKVLYNLPRTVAIPHLKLLSLSVTKVAIWPRYHNLTYLTAVTLNIRPHTPKSNHSSESTNA